MTGKADTSMRKVLIVCNDLDYFLRHRVAAVEHLAAQDWQVTVLCGGRKESPGATRPFELLHTSIRRFAFDPLDDFRLLCRSLKLIWSIRPDAAHLITLKPAVFSGLAALLSRLAGFGPSRVLITIPGLGRLMGPTVNQRMKSALSRKLVMWVIRWLSASPASHFTFETVHDRDRWITQRLVTGSQSTVLPGAGVDPCRFFPAKEDGGNRPLRVLFASRLLSSKGLEAFLLAAEAFSGRTDVEFLVAGMVEPDDPDAFPVGKLRESAAVRFLGEATDMPELLRQSDLICLPTLYGEGIPRILIEAAATAIPAIVTDTSGCREFVLQDKTGVLVQPGPPPALSQRLSGAVHAYLADPGLRVRHGQAAYEKFCSGGYTQDRLSERFEELLAGTLRSQFGGVT